LTIYIQSRGKKQEKLQLYACISGFIEPSVDTDAIFQWSVDHIN